MRRRPAFARGRFIKALTPKASALLAGRWVGPGAGALTIFLLSRWAGRGLGARFVPQGAVIGRVLALIDFASLSSLGDAFQPLFIASNADKMLAVMVDAHTSAWDPPRTAA